MTYKRRYTASKILSWSILVPFWKFTDAVRVSISLVHDKFRTCGWTYPQIHHTHAIIMRGVHTQIMCRKHAIKAAMFNGAMQYPSMHRPWKKYLNTGTC